VKCSISSNPVVWVIAACSLVATLPAWADPPKIGIVDPQKLLVDSPQGKSMLESLRAEFSPRERSLQAQAQSLKAKNDTLQKNGATMTDDQRTRAEKELRDGERDFERARSEFQDDLTARRNEEMSRLQRTLGDEVRNYAKAQNYDVVLSGEAVIYQSQNFDITPAILAALQAHAASSGHGSATPPATPAAPAKPSSQSH
jgi:outer membrane protein